MRILIIGGLGYIGSQLIEQYKSGREDDLQVDILDKRLIPYTIANLPKNFHLIHSDMKDSNVIDSLLQREPAIVYLLAAEVQAERSIEREKAMWENNFEAIVNIIEKCQPETRVMFPSTGNVFGGVDESEKYINLTEADEPRPKYPYAETKRAVEKHLLASDKNFTICRLGTNYGYSPMVRFNLVANNFIKKALTGENITVHGKGENFRPTVCVKDGVRAMLFLSEKEDANGEIFHIVSENFRIKDLAFRIASTVSPSAKIEYIAREVPFSSYNLSGEKIKKAGFKFEWTLDNATKDMLRIFGCLNTRI